MAQRCGCATSRLAPRETSTLPGRTVGVCSRLLLLLLPLAAEAGLYTSSDQIIQLSSGIVDAVLVNSTAATVVEFYASWCGHCRSFSPVYKSLARDLREWKMAVDLAAIDCAESDNRQVCIGYGITGYPTLKFFHAYSKAKSKGVTFRDFPRDVRGLRHRIIDKLEYGSPWPPACPPLEPTSEAELDSFFETNSVRHLALIFEEPGSYIGRETTLDLSQFDNIAVRRVLSTEEGLVAKLGVTEFPSCYLYRPGGNYTRLRVRVEARSFYSYALQRLPGAVRLGKPPPVAPEVLANSTRDPWRPFNRSRVYMADLESALHYSLRVEVAAHTVIRGEALLSLKTFVAVLVKFFPGRLGVMNLLKSSNSWLQSQTGNEISYDAFKQIVDNSALTPDAALSEEERWVGCQGSQPFFRRYPCGVWTLFHVLTVEAKRAGSSDPLEVLSAMRKYIGSYFGCRPCAEHFENMARDSLDTVTTESDAILWLWERHNRVNSRLAGALTEDPNFPKIQWPSPEMCPSCHMVQGNRDHEWNSEEVLSFLVWYFSSPDILPDYLEDETKILAKQMGKYAQRPAQRPADRRRARAASDFMERPAPAQPTLPKEEEEDDEEDEEEDEAAAAAKSETEVGQRRRPAHRRPSVVGMRLRAAQDDIVDLDSFVNQHYNAKALQPAAASRVKQRTLQRQEEQEPRPAFGLGLELDTGLGMVGLRPIDTDPEPGRRRKRLRKRELSDEYLAEAGGPGGRLMSVLSVGFSRADVSLCVILYFLSAACLLAMYLFFKHRFRLRRMKSTLL